MKKNLKYFGMLATLFGIGLNKFLVNRYGKNSSVVMITVLTAIAILALAYLVYEEYYIEVIACLSFVLPLILMVISMYIDNLYLGLIGLILLFVLIPIMIKIYPKYKNSSKL